MKIIVCIKQVPDTTEIKINPDGTLKRDGVPSIMNPDDKAALEFALRLKDEYGAHVSVLSMGPVQAKVMLYEALAMGADEAVLLSDRAFAGSDTWATSTALAGALKSMEYDLILTGRQAIDGDTAQVGPQIAEHLQLPHISYVKQVELKNGVYHVKRQFEDRYQILKANGPLLLTVLQDANTPRYMNVNRLVDATSDDRVVVKTVNDIVVDLTQIGLKGSPTKVKATFNKEFNSERNVVEVNADEAVELIIAKLKERHII